MKQFIEKWLVAVIAFATTSLIAGYVSLYLQVQRHELSNTFFEKRMIAMELTHKEDKKAMWGVLRTKKDR